MTRGCAELAPGSVTERREIRLSALSGSEKLAVGAGGKPLFDPLNGSDTHVGRGFVSTETWDAERGWGILAAFLHPVRVGAL